MQQHRCFGTRPSSMFLPEVGELTVLPSLMYPNLRCLSPAAAFFACNCCRGTSNSSDINASSSFFVAFFFFFLRFFFLSKAGKSPSMDFFGSPKFGGGQRLGGRASKTTGDLGLRSGVLRGASGDTRPGFFRRGVGGTSFKTFRQLHHDRLPRRELQTQITIIVDRNAIVVLVPELLLLPLSTLLNSSKSVGLRLPPQVLEGRRLAEGIDRTLVLRMPGIVGLVIISTR